MDRKDSRKDSTGRSAALFREHMRLCGSYLQVFGRWVFAGLALGLAGGMMGTLFCYGIRFATEFRTAHPWLVWLLPVGGLLIVFLYGLRGEHPTDTNGILLAIHTPTAVPYVTAPLIFVSTVITHLLGGSAGREGAALQLGGVLGSHFAMHMQYGERDTHIVVMAGMSAVFAALFGSPLTAAIFAMEVASVGILHFSAIIPCLTASLTAAYIADALGAKADAFPLPQFMPHTLQNFSSVALIAAICAVVSIFYCVFLRQGSRLFARSVPNPYLRVFLGGLAVALLTWALGTTDYNGAGMPVIEAAMNGEAIPWAFALKLLFTVLTMTCGYKGGEIVPAMFIGATLGCTLGHLLGLPVGLGAAVGLICMFCGSLNCPISAIFLGVELFGGANIQFFAVAAAVSYMLSANFGLYKEQKIVYSKLRPEFINSYTD